jgi:hypothetical protein
VIEHPTTSFNLPSTDATDGRQDCLIDQSSHDGSENRIRCQSSLITVSTVTSFKRGRKDLASMVRRPHLSNRDPLHSHTDIA